MRWTESSTSLDERCAVQINGESCGGRRRTKAARSVSIGKSAYAYGKADDAKIAVSGALPDKTM